MLKINKYRQPFFSIIICTYNRSGLLKRALVSLIRQSEKDWEAIVVDDGSTDSSAEIIFSYIERHNNIKYIYHPNRGLGLSRNTGISLASGKYISFLDSDDEYADNHLDSRKQILMDNPGICLLHGGAKVIGNPMVPDVNNPGKMIPVKDCIIGGTFFIKREIAMESGGFDDLNFGDDSRFFKKIESMGCKVHKTNLKTYIYYRDIPDSICNNV